MPLNRNSTQVPYTFKDPCQPRDLHHFSLELFHFKASSWHAQLHLGSGALWEMQYSLLLHPLLLCTVDQVIWRCYHGVVKQCLIVLLPAYEFLCLSTQQCAILIPKLMISGEPKCGVTESSVPLSFQNGQYLGSQSTELLKVLEHIFNSSFHQCSLSSYCFINRSPLFDCTNRLLFRLFLCILKWVVLSVDVDFSVRQQDCQ